MLCSPPGIGYIYIHINEWMNGCFPVTCMKKDIILNSSLWRHTVATYLDVPEKQKHHSVAIPVSLCDISVDKLT